MRDEGLHFAEFEDFIGSLGPEPALEVLSWLPRVRAADRAAFERMARQQGSIGFTIRDREPDGNLVPAAPREEYFPIRFATGAGGDREELGLDLALEIEWNGTVVSRPSFRDMYWSPAQQLAHLTANGARVRTGDLYASGTVSGPDRGRRGSFLELTWNGQDPVQLLDGSQRTFLEDGDEVVIRATASGPDGGRIGFGEVAGTVLPARATQ
jgi:hypothetical protein